MSKKSDVDPAGSKCSAETTDIDMRTFLYLDYYMQIDVGTAVQPYANYVISAKF